MFFVSEIKNLKKKRYLFTISLLLEYKKELSSLQSTDYGFFLNQLTINN